MKASAIIRICVWTLVALIFTVVLIFGLLANTFNIAPWGWVNYRFEDAHTYSVGNTTLDADAIHSIEIEWVSGSIRIAATGEDQITVRETATSNPNNALRWRIRDGELQIRYCKPRLFGISTPAKDLEILLPATMLSDAEGLRSISIENVSSRIDLGEMYVRDIDIESVSGNIFIANMTVDQLDLENVSGSVRVTNSHLGELDASTVSGNMTIDGEVQRVDLSGVSAQLDLTTAVCPEELSVESVSGLIRLAIPADAGFRLTLDSVSGSLNAPDFSVTPSGNGQYVCGDGRSSFDIETVSGIVNIRKIYTEE